MAQAKSGLFGSDLARLARTARALAHPVRIRILGILAERDVCICGEIVDLLPLSQSTVSQHLKALKGAGLIRGRSRGRRPATASTGKPWGRPWTSSAGCSRPSARAIKRKETRNEERKRDPEGRAGKVRGDRPPVPTKPRPAAAAVPVARTGKPGRSTSTIAGPKATSPTPTSSWAAACPSNTPGSAPATPSSTWAPGPGTTSSWPAASSATPAGSSGST